MDKTIVPVAGMRALPVQRKPEALPAVLPPFRKAAEVPEVMSALTAQLADVFDKRRK